MLVDLRKLKPNPLRDFTVDPVDKERVAELSRHIKEDGFWGGIVCRKTKDGSIEIAAGHHRVEAAILAGETHANVFVSEDMDDAAMIRIYANENATQRGNHGTAQTGSVASAVRYLAKKMFEGLLSGIPDSSPHSIDVALGTAVTEDGIGGRIIVKFLEGVPDINTNTVKQALANLKASGDYARLIHEVQAEIERENREALEALKQAEREQEEAEEQERQAEKAREEAKEAKRIAREAKKEAEAKRAEEDRSRAAKEAEAAKERRKKADAELKKHETIRKTRDAAAKAAESSNGKPITFDFAGVAKHIKNPHQIDVFRKQVTGPGIAPYLPVANQASLAQSLVDKAKEDDRELTGAFIKENLITLVLGVKNDERKDKEEERERLRRHDLVERAKHHQRDFGRQCRGMAACVVKLNELWEEWPKDLVFPVLSEFRRAFETAKEAFDSIYERI